MSAYKIINKKHIIFNNIKYEICSLSNSTWKIILVNGIVEEGQVICEATARQIIYKHIVKRYEDADYPKFAIMQKPRYLIDKDFKND